MPLSLLMALRFSRERRHNRMVSFIAIVSTLGISLGVIVLIVSLSAMNGFERELNNKILSIVPHIEIEAETLPFNHWQITADALLKDPAFVGAAPYINFTGLIDSGTQMKAVQLKGILPQKEEQINTLSNFIDPNVWQHFVAGEQQIIIGQGMADKLQLKVDDWLTIMIPTMDKQNVTNIAQPKRIRLQVKGILNISGQLGQSLALVPLADARQYLEYGSDGVTGIALKVNDAYQVESIAAKQLVNLYVGPAAYTKTWVNQYGHIYRDIQMIRSIMYIAMILVIGVASFNIVSTLVMAVKDKSLDIAVLRTQGATNSLIRSIFIWYGLLTGMLGGLIGVILGIIFSLNLTTLLRQLEKVIHYHFLPSDIYFIDFLPTELHYRDVLIVLLTTILLSLLASWYPAQRACQINPARILSGQ